MPTLEKLGVLVCSSCGKTVECFQAGSDASSAECGACFASAVGHGGMPECWKGARDFIEEATGTFTPEQATALAYYYRRDLPCVDGCEHLLS